ncbi:MAG: hypothetical protein MUF15_08925 [Acidobacteria bacterium]|jgi:hypothetical protein|nr:hypothetical protein [Acidobacteriota bacterium]
MTGKQDNEIILEHYRALRERFVTQGNRLWTRFHYFLTIEAAILGVFLTKTFTTSVSWSECGILFLGLLWSILWFIIGAQDLWFYEQALERLDEFELNYIISNIDGWHKKDYDIPKWKKLVCFKIGECGVTTFASICPGLFIILWVLIWLFG